jgi:hypothetical protein
MLILESNVPYEAEALTNAAFLQTLLLSGEERSIPQPVHPTEPAEGRADLELPGVDRASDSNPAAPEAPSGTGGANSQRNTASATSGRRRQWC